MKLVIQYWDGVMYASRETNKHHKQAEKTRTTKRLDPTLLDDNCRLTDHGDNFHMVFEIKKPKKRKKR